MSLPHWMNFTLIISLILTMSFSHFRSYFESQNSAEAKLEGLELQLAQERMKYLLLNEDLSVFQNQVAQMIPQLAPQINEAPYPMRQLASVVVRPDGTRLREDRSQELLTQAKSLFEQEKFREAIPLLMQYVEAYSYRVEISEAYLLLVESLFQQGRIEEGSLMVRRMMEFFPTNELTGFAMLVLGKALEKQNQQDRALDLYMRVQRHFPQAEVQATTRQFLSEMEL